LAYSGLVLANAPEIISVDASGQPVYIPGVLSDTNRLSADGRVATFVDVNHIRYARVRNPLPGTTVPIARHFDTDEPLGPDQGAGVYQIALSGSGRYAAFVSPGCDLTVSDQCLYRSTGWTPLNVFRTDLETGVTEVVSANINDETGWAAGNNTFPSLNPLISADGRWIAFESFEDALDDIVIGDRCRNVWLRDMAPGGGLPRLVTNYYTGGAISCVGDTGARTAGDSFLADMTPDGRHLVLVSNAPQLTGDYGSDLFHLVIYVGPDDTHTNGQLLPTGIEVHQPVGISRDYPGYGNHWDYYATLPSISDDGNVIAFVNLEGLISVYDRRTESIEFGPKGIFPLISGNGEVVVFQTDQPLRAPDTNYPAEDVYAWTHAAYPFYDLLEIELVSRSAAGGGDRSSELSPRSPAFSIGGTPLGSGSTSNSRPGTMISYDGRYVAFNSAATNLVDGLTYGFGDAFVRDRLTGQTRVASVPLSGEDIPAVAGGNIELDASGTLALYEAADVPEPNSPLPPGYTYAIHTFVHNMRSPVEALNDLKSVTVELNLQKGVANSLDGKLHAVEQALSDLRTNNDVAAVASLQAFIKEVEAQRGINLTNEEADSLVALALSVVELI